MTRHTGTLRVTAPQPLSTARSPPPPSASHPPPPPTPPALPALPAAAGRATATLFPPSPRRPKPKSKESPLLSASPSLLCPPPKPRIAKAVATPAAKAPKAKAKLKSKSPTRPREARLYRPANTSTACPSATLPVTAPAATNTSTTTAATNATAITTMRTPPACKNLRWTAATVIQLLATAPDATHDANKLADTLAHLARLDSTTHISAAPSTLLTAKGSPPHKRRHAAIHTTITGPGSPSPSCASGQERPHMSPQGANNNTFTTTPAERNARRRVYDALKVMVAAGAVVRTARHVRFVGVHHLRRPPSPHAMLPATSIDHTFHHHHQHTPHRSHAFALQQQQQKKQQKQQQQQQRAMAVHVAICKARAAIAKRLNVVAELNRRIEAFQALPALPKRRSRITSTGNVHAPAAPDRGDAVPVSPARSSSTSSSSVTMVPAHAALPPPEYAPSSTKDTPAPNARKRKRQEMSATSTVMASSSPKTTEPIKLGFPFVLVRGRNLDVEHTADRTQMRVTARDGRMQVFSETDVVCMLVDRHTPVVKKARRGRTPVSMQPQPQPQPQPQSKPQPQQKRQPQQKPQPQPKPKPQLQKPVNGSEIDMGGDLQRGRQGVVAKKRKTKMKMKMKVKMKREGERETKRARTMKMKGEPVPVGKVEGHKGTGNCAHRVATATDVTHAGEGVVMTEVLKHEDVLDCAEDVSSPIEHFEERNGANIEQKPCHFTTTEEDEDEEEEKANIKELAAMIASTRSKLGEGDDDDDDEADSVMASLPKCKHDIAWQAANDEVVDGVMAAEGGTEDDDAALFYGGSRGFDLPKLGDEDMDVEMGEDVVDDEDLLGWINIPSKEETFQDAAETSSHTAQPASH